MIPPLKPFAEELYQPISSAAFCGPELERYEFTELNESCTRKEGEWDSFHKKNIGGRDPNYRLARAEAMALLERTRDFRVLARLPVIEANVNGAPGLHAALHLLYHYIQEHWETAHPQILEGNSADRQRVFGALPNAKETRLGIEASIIFKGQGVAGDVTVRNFLVSAGVKTALDGEFVWPKTGLAEEILKSAALERLENTMDSLDAAAELCETITTFLSEVFERPPNLSGLSKELRKFKTVLSEFSSEVAAEAAGFDASDTSNLGDGVGSVPPSSFAKGNIETFEDAEATLDEVICYYARLRRPSPVPLILLKLKDMGDFTYSGWQRTLAINGVDGAALEFGDVDPSRLESYAVSECSTTLATGCTAGAVSTEGMVERIDEVIAKHSDLDGADLEAVSEITRSLQTLKTDLEHVVQSLNAASGAPSGQRAHDIELKGSVKDRRAVVNALESVAVFLECAEPADPRPVLLRRTKSLVERNFLDNIRELAPNGGEVAQLRLEETAKG